MKTTVALQHDIRESKPYDAQAVEALIFAYWEENDVFRPEAYREITGKEQ